MNEKELDPTLRSLYGMVKIANDVDDEIIQKVNRDRSHDSMLEHDIEKSHAAKPTIGKTKQALILVAVAEQGVGRDNCRSNVPTNRMKQP